MASSRKLCLHPEAGTFRNYHENVLPSCSKPWKTVWILLHHFGSDGTKPSAEVLSERTSFVSWLGKEEVKVPGESSSSCQSVPAPSWTAGSQRCRNLRLWSESWCASLYRWTWGRGRWHELLRRKPGFSVQTEETGWSWATRGSCCQEDFHRGPENNEECGTDRKVLNFCLKRKLKTGHKEGELSEGILLFSRRLFYYISANILWLFIL